VFKKNEKITNLITVTKKMVSKSKKALARKAEKHPDRDDLRRVPKSPGDPAQALKTGVPDVSIVKSEAAQKRLKPVRLPRFGKTQLMAFIRDLKCLFTFWEVTPQTIEETKRELGEEYAGSSMFLRMFKKQPDGTSRFLYEKEVRSGEMNRYMDLEEEGGTYFLEISQKTHSGRYLVLAHSNEVQTGVPVYGVSPSDPSWEMPVEIREYFSDEIIEESFKPGKKLFSANLGGQATLHRRRLGPQDRHAASKF